MIRSVFILAVLLVITPNAIFSQCSDAGVCAIGPSNSSHKHNFSLSYVYGESGKADGLSIHSFLIGGSYQVYSSSTITFLLPYTSIKGHLGNTSGIGDLTVLWNQVVWMKTGYELKIQIGGKFATGDDNLNFLPQAYQPGLGTNDVLVGITYETDPWFLALAYQLSRGRSNNAITRLSRGDDVLARAGYKLDLFDIDFGLEMIAIKRLHESSVLKLPSTIVPTFTNLNKSNQFQLNAQFSGFRQMNERIGLKALLAFPLRSRSVNVDGLTRSFTVSLGIVSSF